MLSAIGWWMLPLAVNPYLTQGREQYLQLEYERAEATLRLAEQVPGNSRDERRAIDDLLARTLVAEGRLDDAQAVYRRLLVDDPQAPAPADAAPKIQRLFESAKRRVYAPHFVALTQRPAATDQVAVAIVDPWREVRSVVCGDRPLTIDGNEARGACPPGGTVSALGELGQHLAELALPTTSPENPAATPAAGVAASAAAPAAAPPRALELSEPAPRPFFSRPAPYVALGALGLAAVAAGLGFTAQQQATELNDPGSAREAMQSYEAVRRLGAVAWGLAGAALAAAVACALLFVFGP
jgi:hypothetical protein